MARIKPSVIVSDIRGKIQGSIFQQSGGGLIIKANNKKVNKNSQAQSLIRAYNAYVQNQWLELTNAQRETWNRYSTFANVQQVHNPGYTVNGQQLFIKINVLRLAYGLTILTAPQFSKCITLSVSFSVAISAGDLILTSSRLVDSLVEYVICQASTPVSSALNNPGSRLRTLVFATSTDTDFDITSAYTAVFGRAPVVGETIFIRAWVQNLYSGLATQRSIIKQTL